MTPFDPFTVLIAAAAGAILYAVVIRFIPGKQPGEAKIDALLEKLGIHLDVTTQLVSALAAPVAAVPTPAAPAVLAPVASVPTAVAVPQPLAVTVAAAPVAAVPPITSDGLRARVDAIVPAGTAGTVTLPKTGHVLSLPQPAAGELLMGYALRVCAQAMGDYKTVAGLLIAQSALHSFGPTPDAWPAMVDEYFNTRAYMTADELSRQDNAAAGWNDVYAALQQPRT